MDLFSAWLCIVGCVVLFAAVFLPATMIVAAGNRDRIRELMDAHERNLRSDDPDVVASSKKRWATMCEFIKKDHRNYKTGVMLEQFGHAAEQMFCRPSEER